MDNNFPKRLRPPIRPLRPRTVEVLGEEGVELIAQFKKVCFAPDFDSQARRILRIAKTIPEMELRFAYVRKCIDNASKDEPDPNPWRAGEILAQFMDRIFGQAGYGLWTDLRKIFIERFGRDDDPHDDAGKVTSRVNAILKAAATKKHPIKYVRVVIKNERAENKRRKLKKKAHQLEAAAKERQRKHGDTAPGRKNTSAKSGGSVKEEAREARDELAATFNVSHTRVGQAKKVREK
jgi:hypothetical protein